METVVITTDPARCINCKACEVHCKVINNLPLGSSLGIHVGVGPYLLQGRPVIRSMFLPCQQCRHPRCKNACPTGAMEQRADGIVFVNQTKCTGCGACSIACPWQVPQLNPKTGRMMKCDLCRLRLDAGLEPVCVIGCTTQALSLGTLEAASRQKRQAHAQAFFTGREPC